MKKVKKRLDKKVSLSYFVQKQNKAQIWIETLIYTLIALIMIGAVLAFVKPKIQELQDKAIIEQSIELMEYINTKILSTTQTEGNKRVDKFIIKKGSLKIDGIEDKIVFEMESRYEYSEPGIEIREGNIIGNTEKKGKLSMVTLILDYKGLYDITYQEEDKIKTINKASTPYEISILNKGKSNNVTIIEIEIN